MPQWLIDRFTSLTVEFTNRHFYTWPRFSTRIKILHFDMTIVHQNLIMILLLLLISLIHDWLSKRLSAVPGPPTSLSVVNISSDAVTLSWLRPVRVPGFLQGYRVERQRLARVCELEADASCVESEVILSVNVMENGNTDITETLWPLHKYRRYRVRVVAWTNAGDGEPTEWLYIHTLAGSTSYTHLRTY